jgi:hypothetical protein
MLDRLTQLRKLKMSTYNCRLETAEYFKQLVYGKHDYKVKEEIRFWRVLTMVYNTQDYCVFWTFPSSGILETRKHDVSETGSVSVLRWKGGRRQLLSWAP